MERGRGHGLMVVFMFVGNKFLLHLLFRSSADPYLSILQVTYVVVLVTCGLGTVDEVSERETMDDSR
jgi:hypothetical protein